MSVTIGKNLDTGKITLKFDSTGREVVLTPEESADFEVRMKFIKAEGKLQAAGIWQ